MKSTHLLIGAAIIAVLGIGGVILSQSDDDTSDSTETSQVRSQDAPFNLDVSSLAPLDQGVYEGWVVRDDVKYSFGTFNTDASGNVIGTLDLNGVTPQDGDTIAISIEPDNDTDPEPSATIILAGEFQSGTANLSFPVDISGFSGQYILATPTNDPAGNETAGVWFVDNSNAPNLTASLNIPDAPDGWIYEGWVVYKGETPITTGKFRSATGADQFDGYSGTAQSGPNYPGEDLIMNLPAGLEGPLEFDDGETLIVVSIEPDQNGEDPTGDGPAQLKPLSAVVAEGSADHSLFDLSLNPETPSGTFTL